MRRLAITVLAGLVPYTVQAEILFWSNWDTAGRESPPNVCGVGKEKTCGSRLLEIVDTLETGDVLNGRPDGWNQYSYLECTDTADCDKHVNIRVQAGNAISDDYSLNIQWNISWPGDPNGASSWELAVEELDNSRPGLAAAAKDEFYMSHWVYYSEGYKFPWRMKGTRWYASGANAVSTAGGLVTGICGKRGESGAGYGMSYSDNPEKAALFDAQVPNNDYFTVYVSNYAANSKDDAAKIGTEDEGTVDGCVQSADNNTGIGMNTPWSSSVDIFGPADDGTNATPYWPGCVQEHLQFTSGVWYQVIEHRKIDETDGLIEVWVREGRNGTLKKIIKLDKDAWNGTPFAVSEYDTRCNARNQTSLEIHKFNFYAYMNKFEVGDYSRISSNINTGQSITVDSFIIATTFAEVENYGLSEVEDVIPPVISSPVPSGQQFCSSGT